MSKSVISPSFVSVYQMEAGMANHIPAPGVNAMLRLMKQRYQGGDAWKKFMKCDSIYFRTTTEAYGYHEGRFFTFTATQVANGWQCNFFEGKNVTNEEEQLLRSVASVREALRNAKQCQSSILETSMELRKRLQMSEARCEKLQKELEALKKPEQDEQKEPEVHLKRDWSWLWVLVLAAMVALIPVASAEDCSLLVDGCYVEPGPENAQYSFNQLMHDCYGKTTNVLVGINISDVSKSCINHMKLLHLTEAGWHHKWCADFIQTRLHFVKCEKYDLMMWLKIKTTDVLNMITMENLQALNIVTRFVMALAMLYDANWIGILVVILSAVIKVRLFLLSIAMTVLPIYSFGLFSVLAAYEEVLPTRVLTTCIIVNWFALVLVAFWRHGDLVQISTANFHAVALPALLAAHRMVTLLNIDEFYQVVLFVVSLTLHVGFKYAVATVTIVDADGQQTRIKRITKVTDSAKKFLTKMQAAVRGVIPQFPDKTSSICVVESSVGSGVAFRYQNFLYTVGHVVGSDDVVKIHYNGFELMSNVISKQKLPNCPETLVKMKLPSEMQVVKPLRLSKEETSDYVQLLAFDPNFQTTVTYSGWGAMDGPWLATAFETHPGNSGGPYVDRHGRILGVHLGTQGVVAQGYIVTKVLSNTPQKEEKSEEISQKQCSIDADEILERLIQGTKSSHAQLLAEIEKLVERVKAVEKENSDLRMEIKNCMLNNAIVAMDMVSDEKKKKKKRDRKDFNKIKVLTEEEYRKMMEEGWTKEQIQEAVNSLREQAWLQYEMDLEDDDMDPDDYMESVIDNEYNLRGESTVKDGVKTQTVMQALVQQRKKIVRKKAFHCRYCDKTYFKLHDVVACRKSSKRNIKEPPLPECQLKEIEEPKPQRPPKNGKGRMIQTRL
nr:MAG: NSP1a protein [Avian astrovirus 12]